MPPGAPAAGLSYCRVDARVAASGGVELSVDVPAGGTGRRNGSGSSRATRSRFRGARFQRSDVSAWARGGSNEEACRCRSPCPRLCKQCQCREAPSVERSGNVPDGSAVCASVREDRVDSI